jgi:SAM-dependent methyltransferase/uncharacterized protein YbaR (Trm112 family)
MTAASSAATAPLASATRLAAQPIDWHIEHLVCPRDRARLRASGSGTLRCVEGHDYPVVDGVPVLLVAEAPETIGIARASLRAAESACRAPGASAGEWFVDTLGLDDAERAALRELSMAGTDGVAVDPVVAFLVGATNGIAYNHLRGSLREYPIPALRLPPGDGRMLLDVGCNWGRWCMAAARAGYRPLGIDPSLGAVMAARRVAAALGVDARFVVADARYLPLATGVVDRVFSYSVLQHFAPADAELALQEAGRVLAPGGTSLIQMPTTFGVRCLYHQARRRFRTPRHFEVRYRTLPALRRLFTRTIGPTTVSVDCFFGIGLQASDRALMPRSRQRVIDASERLRALSERIPLLRYVADSVYLSSVKAPR